VLLMKLPDSSIPHYRMMKERQMRGLTGMTMTKKIGIISDTHGLLRQEVLEKLRECDIILHGGDINKQEILDTLAQIAPVRVVRGNNDKEWAEHIPKTLDFQIEGLRFLMVHNKKEVPENLEGIDVVVFGHSHKYFEKVIDGRLWLNPGSCGRRRFDQEISFAVMTVDGQAYQVEKITVTP